MSLVEPSWGLEKSATDVIGIGIGVLQAATSDNVQALALLAAEQFGTTIPMSHESKAKVFRLCAKDESMAVLNFFKAKLGFQRGDSGWHLSRTDAGVRFLGLAACLISTNQWLASEILQKCIEDTAEDKRLIPTTQHLKQLLQVLQPRLVHASFLDAVHGWDTWLSKIKVWHGSGNLPPTEAITQIIHGISLLFRLGETNEKSRIEITVSAVGAAWTIAFLKWCLGQPPSVATEQRVTLLDVSESRVLVLITNPGDNERKSTKVRIIHSIEAVNDLLDLSADRLYHSQHGMVRLTSYCQAWHRKRPRFQIIAQVLPYACRLVLDELRITNGPFTRGLADVSALYDILKERARVLPTGQGLSQYSLSEAGVRFGALLPDAAAISLAMQIFLGLDPTLHEGRLKPLEGLNIMDLPPMQALQRNLENECVCRKCQPEKNHRHLYCRGLEARDMLADAVAIIMFISMVDIMDSSDNPKGFLVRHDTLAPRTLTTPILTILENAAGPAEFRECSVQTLYESLLTWMGHKLSEGESHDWLMSARNGQVLYPKIFDDLQIANTGLLQLWCVPGSIIWKNEQYTTVIKGTTDMEREPEETMQNTGPQVQMPHILGPRNDYAAFAIDWQVAVIEKGLVLSARAPQLISCPDRNPMNAILTAATSLLVECAHDKMSPLPEVILEQMTLRNAPLASPSDALQGDWDLAITLTDDSTAARFFAMCARETCVVRTDACMQCCIDVCTLLHIRILIC